MKELAHPARTAALAPASRLLELDALRGLAALVVVIHHARTLYPPLFQRLDSLAPTLDGFVAFVARRNVEAVWTFFVLSGFSIRLSLEKLDLAEPGGVRDYFRRRARRILPLYWFALAFSGWVAHFISPAPASAISLKTLLGNLLFLQTAYGVRGQWFVPYAANGALWSLSFEAFFYLVYPALVLATGARQELRMRKWRAGCVVIVSMLGLALNWMMPTPLSLFLSAVFVWYAGVELADRWLGRSPAITREWVWPALALTVLLRFGRGWLELHGILLALTALTVRRPTFSSSRGRTRVALHGFAWFGGISYGLYLLHVPVMRAAVRVWGPTPISLAMACFGSVLVAWAAERLARRLPL